LILALVVQRPDGPWPAAAIQDSVAAVIRQAPYRRSVSATLFDRFLDWLADGIRRLFEIVPAVPYAKWIVLGIAILLVIAIAARFVLGNQAEERRRRVRAGAVFGGGDPMAEAERLAAAGDYTEAAHLLYRGVTERLAAGEQIRLHPSKTSGDYARELRLRGSAVHGEFRQFGRRYDHVMFGIGTCDAPTYAALREQATRLVRPEARAA
jgi:hypothetical protein